MAPIAYLDPVKVANLIFAQLATVLARRNRTLCVAAPPKPELYITQQVDLPNVYKIDIDWPTEQDAIKNHYLVRIEVATDGEDTIRIHERMSPAPITFSIMQHEAVIDRVKKAILNY